MESSLTWRASYLGVTHRVDIQQPVMARLEVVAEVARKP